MEYFNDQKMRLQSCWHKISQNEQKKFKKESVDSNQPSKQKFRTGRLN